MSPLDAYSLTKTQIKQMTRNELVTLLLDWLKWSKDGSALLIKENTLQKDLEKAHEQIGLLTEKNYSITKELNVSLKRNKYLECQQIPKLQQEMETLISHRNQLLSDVKHYKNNYKELESSLKNFEKDSKLQAEKMLADKRKVISQLTAYKIKVEKQQNEVKKLQFELSRKIDDIDTKNNEIMREKEKSGFLEAKIKSLKKKLMVAENNLVRNFSKTPNEEDIERNKEEFKARKNLTLGILAEEKHQNRTLLKCRNLSQPQREAEAVTKTFEPRADWRQLERENPPYSSQIKAVTKNKQNDQDYVKVPDQMFMVRKMSINERSKDDSNVKTQTNNKQNKFLPPIHTSTHH